MLVLIPFLNVTEFTSPDGAFHEAPSHVPPVEDFSTRVKRQLLSNIATYRMLLDDVMVNVLLSLLLGIDILPSDAPQLEDAWVVNDTADVTVLLFIFAVKEYVPDEHEKPDRVSMLLRLPFVTTTCSEPSFAVPPVFPVKEITVEVVLALAV